MEKTRRGEGVPAPTEDTPTPLPLEIRLVVDDSDMDVVPETQEPTASPSIFESSPEDGEIEDPIISDWAADAMSTTQATPMDDGPWGMVIRPAEVVSRGSRGKDKRVRKDRSRSQSPSVMSARHKLAMSTMVTEAAEWMKCTHCSVTFTSFSDFRIHLAEAHPGVLQGRFSCGVCTSTHATPTEWLNHMANFHPGVVMERDMEFFDTAFLL